MPAGTVHSHTVILEYVSDHTLFTVALLIFTVEHISSRLLERGVNGSFRKRQFHINIKTRTNSDLYKIKQPYIIEVHLSGDTDTNICLHPAT